MLSEDRNDPTRPEFENTGRTSFHICDALRWESPMFTRSSSFV